MKQGKTDRAKRYLLHYALEYHDRGYIVVPMKGIQPALRTVPSERLTLAELAFWFGRENGSFNLGVVTGPSSNVVAVVLTDSDSESEFLSRVPTTPLTARMSDGALLLLYRHPGKQELGSYQRDGLSVSASGEVVLLPPSVVIGPIQSSRWLHEGDYSEARVPEFDERWLERFTRTDSVIEQIGKPVDRSDP